MILVSFTADIRRAFAFVSHNAAACNKEDKTTVLKHAGNQQCWEGAHSEEPGATHILPNLA